MPIIAIIGFGFCGKLTFINLVKNLSNKYQILIFDKSEEGFSSTAFAEFSPHYVLNVAVEKMTAFSEDKLHFFKFLEEKYPEISKKIGQFGFAPRYIFGQYIDEILSQYFTWAKKNKVDFQLINQEVVNIKESDTQKEFLITTKSNQNFKADKIVLATSFLQSELPSLIESKNLITNLWHKNSLWFHQKNFIDEKICLIGSGLTAVDVIAGLRKKNFRGKIFVISRRGNFPKKHFLNQQKIPNLILADDAKKGVLFLFIKIRQFLRLNPEFDLRHIVDSVRHITKELWQNFDQKNKKLFLRFLPYWNIFRHRAPVESIEIIEEMIAKNQLEIFRGGLKSFSKDGEKILLKTKSKKFETDYLINCLGFEFRAEKYPLLKQMIACDLLKQDLMMVCSNHKKIHLVGGLNIGRDFECTSVPDLRANVEKIIPLLMD